MTGKTEESKSAGVKTPLHLLQVLTRTLNEHLAEACNQAEADASKALEKLDRERLELEAKLAEASEQLSARQEEAAGKSVDEPTAQIDELNSEMATLEQARNDAQAYIRQLQHDVRQTLRLAKGLERIDVQVTQAIEKRDNPSPSVKNGPRSAPRRTRSRKPAAAPNAGTEATD